MKKVRNAVIDLKGQKEKRICKTRIMWILVIAFHSNRTVHCELVNGKTTEDFELSMKRLCN